MNRRAQVGMNDPSIIAMISTVLMLMSTMAYYTGQMQYSLAWILFTVGACYVTFRAGVLGAALLTELTEDTIIGWKNA